MKKSTKKLIAEAAELLADIRRDLHKRIKFGGMLVDLQDQLEHGEWETTVKDVLKLSAKGAFNFMDLYYNRDVIKTELASNPNLTQAAALDICRAARRLPKPKSNSAREYYLRSARQLWRPKRKGGEFTDKEYSDKQRERKLQTIRMHYRRFKGHERPAPRVANVASHFLDSGSFSLKSEATKYKDGVAAYYRSPRFEEYPEGAGNQTPQQRRRLLGDVVQHTLGWSRHRRSPIRCEG